MTPVIRIDDQVMNELKKRAIGLGLVFEPPNATLRIILGLDAAMKAIADEIVEEALKKFAENKNVIEIKLNASSPEYVLIPLPKDKRHFFPGFKRSFELITDIGVSRAYITSNPGGAAVGDPKAGCQLRGGLGKWYAKHPELKGGTRLRIEALEPGKRYKLSIVSEGV